MKNIVEIAENEIDIVQVCNLIGMNVESSGRAIKYLCPFAELYHSRPSERSFRVYPDTNSAFCFASCGYFTPVSLYAKASGYVTKEGKLRLRDAAKALMSEFGHQESSGYSLEELRNPKPTPISTKLLGQALEMYMHRAMQRSAVRDMSTASEIYAQLVNLLPQIHDDAAAEQWMIVGKQAISQALDVEED